MQKQNNTDTQPIILLYTKDTVGMQEIQGHTIILPTDGLGINKELIILKNNKKYTSFICVGQLAIF